uniref:Uncharacterized protein n=1 Tax=Mycena chlorophos TaxID=658473 RepID=A0ABQ0L418_MYCCL|nr:predicted protein [Mycena chlorophos]
MADLGCAQNPDLTLRDTSEITFYNHADDEQPISGPSVHPLLLGVPPLQKVAGVRHSNRQTKLSARAKATRGLDTDSDAPASSTKRKEMSPGRKTMPKVARITEQHGPVPTTDNGELESPNTDLEDADTTIQARGAFERFKAMGDADHAQVIQIVER